MNKIRLFWNKEPNEQGLASIGQAPRGAFLKVNGVIVGRVYAYTVSLNVYDGGWWIARDNTLGIPLRNTCNDNRIPTLDEAKTACEAYVRQHLGLPERAKA